MKCIRKGIFITLYRKCVLTIIRVLARALAVPLEVGRGEEAVSVLEWARLLRPDDIDIQAQVGLLAERYSLSALATQACGRAVDLAKASQGGSAESDSAVRRCAEVIGVR